MKITLRQSEVDSLISALNMAINYDFPNSDPSNAAYLRLIKKLKEAK